MNRDTIDRYCERGILGLVLAIVVFGPLAGGAVRTQEFLVLLAGTATVLFLWCVRLWLNERPKLLCPPISWPVLGFGAYAIVRYFTCDIEYIGRLELLRVLVYTTFFFAILNNLHRQESAQAIAFTMVFVAMCLAMCAIWQYLARAHRVPSLGALLESVFFSYKRGSFARLYMDRASATYINPNHLAGFLEMLLPIGLAYTLSGRCKPVTRIFLGYAALVILAGIGVTGSRGSWAATAVSLMVLFGFLALHRSYRLPAILMFLLVGGASTYFVTNSQFFKQRVQPTLVEGQLRLDMRYELWDATVRMWEDNLWYGVGPGHFDYRFRAYRPQSVQLRPDRAHNEYLNALVDWGVVGATLIGSAIVILIWGVFKTWRYVRRSEREFNSNRSNKFAFVLGASVGLLALLGHSIVDFNMQIPANAILAVTLVALLSGYLRFASDRYWFGANIVAKILISLVLIVGFGFFFQQTSRLGREYFWLERASTKPNYSDEKIAVLEKAYAAESKNSETAFAIGECYRTQSFEGGHEFEDRPGYEELGNKALIWFRRGTNSNAYDYGNFVSLGRTLDWLNQTTEGNIVFKQAAEIDPNSYWTSNFIGVHYVQMEDYAAAREWFERSLKLQSADNKTAETYLEVVNQRLLENAAVQPLTPAASSAVEK
jgi:O-antigen ligase